LVAAVADKQDRGFGTGTPIVAGTLSGKNPFPSLFHVHTHALSISGRRTGCSLFLSLEKTG
jgi:hypothetical protein